MQVEIYRIRNIGEGFLAIMAKPRTGDWLEDEIAGLRQIGVDLVVSLLEPPEVLELELSRESDLCERNGLAFVSFPIPDRGVPDSTEKALELASNLFERISLGDGVVIHCRSGIGRAAMLAASVLLCDGVDPAESFRLISEVRRVPVPDTEEQLRWVEDAYGRST